MIEKDVEMYSEGFLLYKKNDIQGKKLDFCTLERQIMYGENE